MYIDTVQYFYYYALQVEFWGKDDDVDDDDGVDIIDIVLTSVLYYVGPPRIVSGNAESSIQGLVRFRQ